MTNYSLVLEGRGQTTEIEKIKGNKKEIENDSLAKERALIRKGIKMGKEQQRLGSKEITKCPECGSSSLKYDKSRAETVCQQCALVLEENKVDPGPEWNSYDAEERARTGPPSNILVHDKGLSTMIDWKNKDSQGKCLQGEAAAKMGRLRKWQRRLRIRNPKDRNLSFALGELDRMTSALGITRPVQQTAAVMYRKAVGDDIIRGRSIEGMITACLYAACKQSKVSRTLDEIAGVSRVSRLHIGRSYRVLISSLKLGILPPSAMEFVSRFCSPFEFPDNNIRSSAENIIRQAEGSGVTSGKGPEGIAAAAIYIAAMASPFRYRVTQKKLAKIAGVTEVTIRNRYKELVKVLHLKIEET